MKKLFIIILLFFTACSEEVKEPKPESTIEDHRALIEQAGFTYGGILSREDEFRLASYSATNVATPGILYQIIITSDGTSIINTKIIGNSNIIISKE